MPKIGGAERFSATIKITKQGSVSYRRALGMINPHGRSTLKITETPTSVRIDIAAKDAAALRATLNSALKDLHVIESVANL